MINTNTFETVANLWKIEKKKLVKLSTFSTYCTLLDKHLIYEFKDQVNIQEEMVQNYVFKKINEGLNEKTIKDTIIVLKMILKFGAKHKMMEYQPITIQYPTNYNKKNIDILSRDKQKELLVYLTNNITFKNLGLIICLNSGLRIGELCALKWSDIDIEEGIIKIRHTIQRIYLKDNCNENNTKIIIDSPKTKDSIRDVPISNNLMEYIKPIKRNVLNDNFILTNTNKPTEPKAYRNYYKRLLKKIGLPDIKFHGLRHSFATRLIESNSDYKTVSEILGHSNISTTLNLYVHPNIEQKKKCIDNMLSSL